MTAPEDTRSLSEHQARILDFLRAYWREYGYSPSIRDLMEGARISSTSVVDYNLRLLQRMGLVRLPPAMTTRAIVPVGEVCHCCGREI